LFGSRARGDSGINSDWDILILVDQYPVDRVSEQIYREVIFDIELETGEPISIFVFSKKDWESRHTITPLYRNVRKEGVLL
jgi:predicted nucleotidyltransferase